MRKKLISLSLMAMMVGTLCACGNSKSTQTTTEETQNTESAGEVTSLELSDISDYIDLGSSIYVVEGTNANNIASFSYDSDVIEDVSFDTSEVDTSHVSSDFGDMYDVDYTIVVNVDEYCEKENMTNGMTGNTVQLSGTITVTVVTEDWADEMIENGASPENIIGY